MEHAVERARRVESAGRRDLVQAQLAIADQLAGLVQADVQQVVVRRAAHLVLEENVELPARDARIADQRLAQFAQDGASLVMSAANPRAEATRYEEGLPNWRREFSMAAGRGVAMELEGDGSGAVVLLQLHGRGVRDYVVKVDFKGPRSVVIPSGEASWAEGCWGWRFGAKHFDYERVGAVSLGFGSIPAHTSPKVKISNLRTLADAPSKLVNPVIRTGAGSLTVQGEVESGCYLRYNGGKSATVHDRNWKTLRTLSVACDSYVMPSGFAPVSVTVAEGAPRPGLELQAVVAAEPILVP